MKRGLIARAAVGLGLLGVIALECRGAPAPVPAGSVSLSRPAAASPGPAGRPADLTAEILARPLVSPDRRPAKRPASAAAPDGLPRLAGTMVSGGGRWAIFAAPREAKPMVLTEGAAIGLFTIRAIAPGAVTLDGRNGERVLHPSSDAKQPPGSRPGMLDPADTDAPTPPSSH